MKEWSLRKEAPSSKRLEARATRLKIYIKNEAGLDRAYRDRAKKLLSLSLKELHLDKAELSVLFIGDSGIQALNRQYLGKNRPTDVLSFPMDDPSVIGDIVISVDRAREQSKEFGVSLNEELARLLVHGLLHLLGYDHVKGGRQAKKMRDREEGLLRSLVKTIAKA